ncbi:flippase [Ramlibacter sp. Leaf400]|uniref:flippase n=1 Tax=Ramlibacter sp. Leaf400 TaxID=1736365 RepID=UPI0006FDDADB|nr:flippase [Ramlibacter sp. Leaf400]KQT14360.1 hypothetical protein ASG30_01935 [Ramlibacter sp. Leaf400]
MLLRNAALNLFGLGAPLLVAAATIPALLTALGTERFGFLALMWALVSYFGLFDLGLGRAVTHQLASRYADPQPDSGIGRVLGTALALMTGIGVVTGVLMALGAERALPYMGRLPDAAEGARAILWMALAMPAIVATSGLRGALEARQAFGIVNAIRVPMGLFTYLGPLLVVWWVGPRLDWMAAVLSFGRIVACLAHAGFVLRGPHAPARLEWSRDAVRPMLRTGGWMSVSNVVGPLMGNADRFIIAALLSATAVTYYAVPHELVSKLWVVPGALTAVLFPAFVVQASRGTGGGGRLFRRAVRGMALAMLPVTAALSLFAPELLNAWLGPEMARNCAPLLQLFAVGVFLNGVATIPYTLLQGAGHSRTTALVHCFELPVFMGLMWWLTQSHGVLGATVAWLLRMVFDTVAMFVFAPRALPGPVEGRWDVSDAAWLVAALLAFAASALPDLAPRVTVAVALVGGTAFLAARQWRLLSQERSRGGPA